MTTPTPNPPSTPSGTPTYAVVPSLYDLFPNTAGLPGVTYAIVTSLNFGRAQDEGWGPVENTPYFQLNGPKGTSLCGVFCKGTPIAGARPTSGARVLMLDNSIHTLTGLWVGEEPAQVDSTPAKTAAAPTSPTPTPATKSPTKL